jgi:hypothetical protein
MNYAEIKVDGKNEAMLVEQWEAWCLKNNLECLSADELLMEYHGQLTWDQKDYVNEFIATWDELMEAQFEAYQASLENV